MLVKKCDVWYCRSHLFCNICGTLDQNDSQSDVLVKKTRKNPHGIFKTLPNSLPLMSSAKKLTLQEIWQV